MNCKHSILLLNILILLLPITVSAARVSLDAAILEGPIGSELWVEASLDGQGEETAVDFYVLVEKPTGRVDLVVSEKAVPVPADTELRETVLRVPADDLEPGFYRFLVLAVRSESGLPFGSVTETRVPAAGPEPIMVSRVTELLVEAGEVQSSSGGMEDRGAPATGCAAPEPMELVPPPDAVDVSTEVVISAVLLQSECGVDPSSLSMTIQGHAVTPTLEVLEDGVLVSYRPDQPFDEYEVVLVELEGCAPMEEPDMIAGGTTATGSGPCVQQVWSFTCAGGDITAPYILAAGYGNSSISSEFGGTLTIGAMVQDPDPTGRVDRVELLYQGFPTGLLLLDDGQHADFGAGDGMYGLILELPPGVPAGEYLFEIAATDQAGNTRVWPYLTIDDGWSVGATPAGTEVTWQERRRTETEDLEGAPRILYAGFYDSDLTSFDGGTLRMLAVLDDPDGLGDIVSVEVYYGILPAGIFLVDDGLHGDFAAGDGIFGFEVELEGSLPAGQFELNMVATDSAGSSGTTWPYLTIR